MHNYVAFYQRHRIVLQAESLYQAKLKAVAHFRLPPARRHLVSVVLADAEVSLD